MTVGISDACVFGLLLHFHSFFKELSGSSGVACSVAS